MQHLKLQIEGMSCGHCVARVEKTLGIGRRRRPARRHRRGRNLLRPGARPIRAHPRGPRRRRLHGAPRGGLREAGMSAADSTSTTVMDPAAGAKITIPVEGMTCAACQARVQKALQRQPGVLDASVNLMMNNAAVTYDPARHPAGGARRGDPRHRLRGRAAAARADRLRGAGGPRPRPGRGVPRPARKALVSGAVGRRGHGSSSHARWSPVTRARGPCLDRCSS